MVVSLGQSIGEGSTKKRNPEKKKKENERKKKKEKKKKKKGRKGGREWEGGSGRERECVEDYRRPRERLSQDCWNLHWQEINRRHAASGCYSENGSLEKRSSGAYIGELVRQTSVRSVRDVYSAARMTLFTRAKKRDTEVVEESEPNSFACFARPKPCHIMPCHAIPGLCRFPGCDKTQGTTRSQGAIKKRHMHSRTDLSHCSSSGPKPTLCFSPSPLNSSLCRVPRAHESSRSLLVSISCTEENQAYFAEMRQSSCVVVGCLGGCVVLEVRMVAGRLGRDATSRVVNKHHLQQVESVGVEVLAEGLAVIASPLGKGGLEVWVAGHTWPLVLRRRSQNSADPMSVDILETVVTLAVGKRTGRS